MAVVEQLLRSEDNGTISFGNHKLAEKAKLDNFEFNGDIYKVKTYSAMTKLEKNGMFVYESVPGTSVNDFSETTEGMDFVLEADQDAQITVGLEADAEYEIFINGESVGKMGTNLAGKLNLSVETEAADTVSVKTEKR